MSSKSPTRVINEGPRPKHAQLRDALAEPRDRELGPDAAIPSERELMATYDVSRATVRKAIESLIADGLLHRIHGKGTFVARPRLESRLHLASFSQDMRRRGLTPSTRLLRIELDEPPADVAEALGLGADRAAWRLDRVRSPTASRSRSRTAGTRERSSPTSTGTTSAARCTSCSPASTASRSTAPSRPLWGETADASTARRLDAPVNTPLLVFRRVSCAAGPSSGVRRLPLPGRPLPDPHVPGP